eukprot:RCo044665
MVGIPGEEVRVGLLAVVPPGPHGREQEVMALFQGMMQPSVQVPHGIGKAPHTLASHGDYNSALCSGQRVGSSAIGDTTFDSNECSFSDWECRDGGMMALGAWMVDSGGEDTDEFSAPLSRLKMPRDGHAAEEQACSRTTNVSKAPSAKTCSYLGHRQNTAQISSFISTPMLLGAKK